MPRIAIVVCAVLMGTACTGNTSQTSPASAVVSPPDSSTSTTVLVDPLLVSIEELTALTADLRGLEFLTPPNVVLVSDEELADRVRSLIEEELEPDETRRDELLLSALGLVGEDTDLGALYTDLYSEQVAGYYDGEVGELVVPVGDGDLTALQRLTLVHELTHALTDQHFGFAERMIDLDESQRFEEVMALAAVVEGDATLTETLYLGSLPRADQLELLDETDEIDTEVFDRTPRYIQELLLFPYTTGFEFVSDVWESGGFSAVDGLYATSPTTTEHIFHPADFRVGEPASPVTVSEFVPEGYEVAEASVWGQAAFRAMFGQALDDRTATAAAVGWGGDAYRLMWDGDAEIVFDLTFVADSSIDLDEMFETLVAFAVRQVDADQTDTQESYIEMEGGDFATVFTDGEVIRFVVATDPAVGRLFAEQLAP